MTVLFRRRAKFDLAEACRWYAERQPDLGEAFREEVEELLERIQAHPEINPRVDERVRRAALRRFPYGLFYVVEGETIRVLAILHRARNPRLWRGRT